MLFSSGHNARKFDISQLTTDLGPAIPEAQKYHVDISNP